MITVYMLLTSKYDSVGRLNQAGYLVQVSLPKKECSAVAVQQALLEAFQSLISSHPERREEYDYILNVIQSGSYRLLMRESPGGSKIYKLSVVREGLDIKQLDIELSVFPLVLLSNKTHFHVQKLFQDTHLPK